METTQMENVQKIMVLAFFSAVALGILWAVLASWRNGKNRASRSQSMVVPLPLESAKIEEVIRIAEEIGIVYKDTDEFAFARLCEKCIYYDARQFGSFMVSVLKCFQLPKNFADMAWFLIAMPKSYQRAFLRGASRHIEIKKRLEKEIQVARADKERVIKLLGDVK
jgi:hypothetical protein